MQKILVVLIICATMQCSTNANRERAKEDVERAEESANRSADVYQKMPFFPAETIIVPEQNHYAVQITAGTGAFFEREFAKEDLYGNGYCWAGIIEQLIASKNPRLHSKITFDPEADTCFMQCVDEATANELAKTIHEYCSTREKLADLLDSVDKGSLDC